MSSFVHIPRQHPHDLLSPPPPPCPPLLFVIHSLLPAYPILLLLFPDCCADGRTNLSVCKMPRPPSICINYIDLIRSPKDILLVLTRARARSRRGAIFENCLCCFSVSLLLLLLLLLFPGPHEVFMFLDRPPNEPVNKTLMPFVC